MTSRMFRPLTVALLTLPLLLAGASAEDSIKPPAPPAAPAEPAEVTLVEPESPPAPTSHVRRYRMKRGATTIVRLEDYDPEAVERLQAEIELQREELEQLEADEAQSAARARGLEGLADLEKQLAEMEELELALPELSIITGPNGRTQITMPPSVRPWRKKQGDQVAVFEHLYIDPNEWVKGAALAILGNVHVEGYVAENAISVGGNIYVNGTVAGDVVALFGDVYLDDGAVVEGNIIAIEVFADDGAIIEGTIEEVSLPRIPGAGRGIGPFFALLATLGVSLAVLAILLGLLVQAAAPDNVDRVEQRLRARPVASFFAGLLVEVLVLPVFILLVVTVIGIPVAFLALPLLIVAALLLGFVAFSRIVGQALAGSEDNTRPRWLVFTLGAVLLHTPLLIAMALHVVANDSVAGVMLVVTNLTVFLGLSVLYIASTVGVGAAIFSRLGTRSRPKRAHRVETPPGQMPPPPPQAPGQPQPGGPTPDAT
jgi:hypothetical protein